MYRSNHYQHPDGTSTTYTHQTTLGQEIFSLAIAAAYARGGGRLVGSVFLGLGAFLAFPIGLVYVTAPPEEECNDVQHADGSWDYVCTTPPGHPFLGAGLFILAMAALMLLGCTYQERRRAYDSYYPRWASRMSIQQHNHARASFLAASNVNPGVAVDAAAVRALAQQAAAQDPTPEHMERLRAVEDLCASVESLGGLLHQGAHAAAACDGRQILFVLDNIAAPVNRMLQSGHFLAQHTDDAPAITALLERTARSVETLEQGIAGILPPKPRQPRFPFGYVEDQQQARRRPAPGQEDNPFAPPID